MTSVLRTALAALAGLMLALPALPAAAALAVNADGTLIDNVTGLVWDRCAWGRAWNGSTEACDAGGAETFAWADALKAAVAANTARHLGYDDWRLPSKNELESLVDIGATASPAIDPRFPWPHPGSEFWTSTTYVPTPANAWHVDFHDGAAAPRAKEDLLRVRLVRGGRSGAASAPPFDTLADVVPPVLSGVGMSGIGQTSATLSATSSEAATGYWIVVARDAQAPTAARIAAGVDYDAVTVVARGSGPMSAGTAASFPIVGLVAGTDYDLWLVARDGSVNANFSAPAKVSFSTTAESAGGGSYGPIPTRKSGVTAMLTVAGCAAIDTARFIDAPPGGPEGMRFPYGLLDFTLSDCGATATVTVTYSESLPEGSYYKETAGAYAPYPATVEGNRTRFDLTDNGTGDDDLTPGIIRDPSGLAVAADGAVAVQPVPALGAGGLTLLAVLLGGLGMRTRRATARKY